MYQQENEVKLTEETKERIAKVLVTSNQQNSEMFYGQFGSKKYWKEIKVLNEGKVLGVTSYAYGSCW